MNQLHGHGELLLLRGGAERAGGVIPESGTGVYAWNKAKARILKIIAVGNAFMKNLWLGGYGDKFLFWKITFPTIGATGTSVNSNWAKPMRVFVSSLVNPPPTKTLFPSAARV